MMTRGHDPRANPARFGLEWMDDGLLFSWTCAPFSYSSASEGKKKTKDSIQKHGRAKIRGSRLHYAPETFKM